MLHRILALTLLLALPLVSAAAASFRVYVSNERAGTITVLDGTTHTALATWPVGKRPRGIHLSADGRTLYVAVSGSPRLGPGVDPERAKSLMADKAADGIAILDAATGTLQRKLDVGSDPEEFALSPDGRTLYVSNEDVAQASAWDIATGKKRFAAPVTEEPEGVAHHPMRPEIYVTCEEQGDVFILAATTGKSLARIRTGGRPRKVAFSRDATQAFVPIEGGAHVAIIDTRTRQLAGTIAIPGERVLPMDAAVSHFGDELYVSTGRGNTIAVVDLSRRTVLTHIPVGERVWGIALAPDGRTLFTANGASNNVSVVAVQSRRELQRIPVGDGPWGVVIGPALP